MAFAGAIMNGFSIRDCHPEDVEAVLQLWRQADATPGVTDTAGNLKAVIAASRAKVLVAQAEGRLIGSIIGTFDGWRGNIYRLAVHPDYRRQGVARALVAEVERDLARQGAKRITALVEKDHGWATAFWEAVGYGRDNRIVRHVRNLDLSPASTDERASSGVRLIVNDCVHLSEFLHSDKAALVEHLKEKEIYDRTLRIPYPYTEADADKWFDLSSKTTQKQGQPVHWAIRNEEGLLIGGCGFDGFQIGESHRAEVGYWLAKPYWGQGIVTAVVNKVCDFAFAEWRLSKITAHVFAFNSASARVLEKCGFEQEGYLKKHYVKDGKLIDARLYALSR
jgi:RimJ/RimL family protein N-acetyltransferase